jgi:hypothetical protein
MTDEELTRRTRALDPEDRAGIAALGRALRDEALVPARAVLRYWQGFPQKAPAAVGAMGETALAPLLQAETPASAGGRVALARAIAEAIFSLERRIFARFYNFYQDGREVPPPEETGPSEEPEPDYRVCDEAYVLLRQLANYRESEEQFLMNRDAFLNMPDELKDDEIRKARDTVEFSALVEDLEEEEEGA